MKIIDHQFFVYAQGPTLADALSEMNTSIEQNGKEYNTVEFVSLSHSVNETGATILAIVNLSLTFNESAGTLDNG